MSLLVVQEESDMRAFENDCRITGLLLIVLIGTIAVPRPALADDNNTDKNAGNPAAKSAPAKVEAPAPLTERERWLLDEVEELKRRVAELESKVNPPAAHVAPAAPAAEASAAQPAPSNAANPSPALSHVSLAPAAAVGPPQSPDQSAASAAAAQPTAPFAYADWTWLNGNARNKDEVWDSKYFTPEFRVDSNYIEDYNQPKDHTMGGSTESFRNGEVQLEQLSFGGNLNVGNVRGRILTMFGLFATTTPRNDGSAGVGQWNLNDAYKYFSEAYGGYHFNVNHGLNIDAGIFVSYIGLFSYYNFDNWAYQPSFVSSNTPWFFNGVRIQWFPTDKLKIEPWFINGWQSYAK